MPGNNTPPPMEAGPAPAPRRKFFVEFLIALAAHTFFMILYYPQIFNPSETMPCGAANFRSFNEQQYQIMPALATQTRIIKRGFFPGWTPYSEGGTPLLGKMQNGVFAPHHLLLYALPLKWMPFLFVLIVFLKSYLAFAFTYLYARALRLNLFAAMCAGVYASRTAADDGETRLP